MYHPIYQEHLAHKAPVISTSLYDWITQQWLQQISSIESPIGVLATGGMPASTQAIWQAQYPHIQQLSCCHEKQPNSSSSLPHIYTDPTSWPLADQSVDICAFGPALSWIDPFKKGLQTLISSLRPGGTLLLAGLGPQTSAQSPIPGMPEWIDMQMLGDTLQQLGLLHVSVSQIILTLRYPSAQALIQDIKDHGLWVVSTTVPYAAWRQWLRQIKSTNGDILWQVQIVFARGIQRPINIPIQMKSN